MGIQSGDKLTPARLNKRSVRARRTTVQSLTSGTLSPITFDTEDFDNAAMFAGPSTLITLPVAGLWGFAGYAGVQSNATGQRRLLVELGTSGVYPTIDSRNAVSGDITHMTVAGSHLAAAAEQLRLVAHHTAGVALNLLADAYFTAWLIES